MPASGTKRGAGNKKALQIEDLQGFVLAEWTGLEPATPGVTGRYSNQLNYHSKWLSPRSSRCASATKLGVP